MKFASVLLIAASLFHALIKYYMHYIIYFCQIVFKAYELQLNNTNRGQES